MAFLRWIGAIVVFIWSLNFIFEFGGSMAPLLTVIAPIMFITAMTFKANKT
ncbi:hypothetical protein LGK95_02940 [Clostridium algoriphilum]|uniref:hypothetical protein n=1 Tax=Clostridium algoriphilum TaxID=198347 RepID=UPI001CF4ED47|nr:hypothetical protein [Clostridium algoriphilum]MCB2292497.1 hypothetical protein [Clostridium algoriphilum]